MDKKTRAAFMNLAKARGLDVSESATDQELLEALDPSAGLPPEVSRSMEAIAEAVRGLDAEKNSRD